MCYSFSEKRYVMKKVYKNILVILIAVALSVSVLSGFGVSEAESSYDINDKIIAKFAELTQIPRPSEHEQQVSDYLCSWAEKQGFPVIQDEWNNLIIDVPATEGMEDKPPVALQGHMDMVFAQKDGLELDPYTTVIQMKNDGKWLTSDGRTSLGADDGIGVAIIECVAEGEMAHGPLRILFTTNEENGCTGANNIDPQCVSGVEYMINLDDEEEGQIVISSASGVRFEYSCSLSPAAATGNMGVGLFLNGLTGGHSGDNIDKSRLNGIIAMGEFLSGLKKAQIDFELSSLSGGLAVNAIPTGAEAVLCIAKEDFEKLTAVCNDTLNAFRSEHSDTDPDMALKITETELPGQVLSGADTDRVLGYLGEQFNGVYSMSRIIDGLVESSSNLGIIALEPTGFSAKGMLRSSDMGKQEELKKMNRKLAEKLQFELTEDVNAAPWPAKEDSRLQKIAEEAYRELFSAELNVIAIHAGLECGVFSQYNPEMDVIAMGPTLIAPHSVQETLEIETCGKVWALLESILKLV